MTVLSMSKQEFSRLDVLLRVQSGRLRVADACALMGLHRRQVFRLLRGLLGSHGDAGDLYDNGLGGIYLPPRRPKWISGFSSGTGVPT